MHIEQTVDIPANHRLYIDVPQEVPQGKAVIRFTPLSAPAENKDIENAEKIWAYNRANPHELKAKLIKLQGSLGSNTFDGLEGVAYQRKIRDEWNG